LTTASDLKSNSWNTKAPVEYPRHNEVIDGGVLDYLGGGGGGVEDLDALPVDTVGGVCVGPSVVELHVLDVVRSLLTTCSLFHATQLTALIAELVADGQVLSEKVLVGGGGGGGGPRAAPPPVFPS